LEEVEVKVEVEIGREVGEELGGHSVLGESEKVGE
jgi:hypothetical protein